MSLPGYDAWKLDNPNDITAEEERRMEEDHREQIENFREQLDACISDNRGDLTRLDIAEIVAGALKAMKPSGPGWINEKLDAWLKEFKL